MVSFRIRRRQTAESHRRADWLREQADQLEALAGRDVAGWRGVEMAIIGGGHAGSRAVFTDPRAPFMQFYFLEISLDSGGRHLIETYQDDDGFGLWLTDRRPGWEGHEGIFRTTVPDLPTGPIEAAQVTREADLLAEVTLTIAGQELLVIAGETRENWDGGFDLCRFDESVLVFTDIAAADRPDWRPLRPLSARE